MPKIVTQEQFISNCIKTHSNTYDLSKVVYVSARDSIIVGCPIHGDFVTKPINFIGGKTGCPKCAGKGVDWISRFKQVHGETYSYEQVVYEDYKKPVKILCYEHGVFLQTPDNHYRGKQGCPKCKGKRIALSKQLPFDEFVERARRIHNDKFTYTCSDWRNMIWSNIDIHCPHGVYTQTAVNHLAGKVPCQKCGNMKSKDEEAIANYLKIFTTIDQRNRSIIKPKELDIYLPEQNLAVEYSGMFWHSHGSVEEELKNKSNHYNKYVSCADKGIRLLTIYEAEWMERPFAIKRLLRNAIGKSKGKLMARKCELKKVEHKTAVAFYEKYHPQGGAGSGEHYGLYWNNKLVACMRFTYGANDRGTAASNRVWTLSRYATRITVSGGASKLFKAFVDEYSPSEIKSFSDNRYFSGAMYTQLGFALEENSKPDYQVWSTKAGLKSKSQYQRRYIQARLKEHGCIDIFDANNDPRSERDMIYYMGARKIYDCGKKRWIWTPQITLATQ